MTGPPEPSGSLSFLDHLEELRRRLWICLVAIAVSFAVCYAFSGPILQFLLKPLKENIFKGGDIVYITLTEPFMIYMKAAFFGSIILASPVIFFEIWRFVSPACTATRSDGRSRSSSAGRCCSYRARASPTSSCSR
jgi:sec-independent protein translocase protein TatC